MNAVETSQVELGFRAAAAGSGARPGVVIVHDVWGLTDHTRDLARRLAAEGFAVLAADLYRREEQVEISDAGAWMRGLSDPQVLADLAAARDWLAARAECSGRVGVVGFCMGGSYALLAACQERGFEAAVPFYGMLSHRHGLLHDPEGLDPERKPWEPLAVAPELRCPLLAFFGAEDEFIPLEDVRALERALEPARAGAEVVIVSGAGHAFMNDTRPQAYRPEAAAVSWARMVEFLRATLT